MTEPNYELRSPHTRAHYDKLAEFYRCEREDLQGTGRTLLMLAIAVSGGKLLAWHHLDASHPQVDLINGLLLVALTFVLGGAICQIASLAHHQPARVELPHATIDESVEDDQQAEQAALTTAHHLAGLGARRLGLVRRLHTLSGVCIGLGIVTAAAAFVLHRLGL